MIKCWNCKSKLVRGVNTSREHIIPDFLGGAKGFWSYDLLCKTCNEYYGSFTEAELDRRFGHIAILLDVDRDRKDKNLKIVKAFTKEGQIRYIRTGMRGGRNMELSFLEQSKLVPFKSFSELQKAKNRKMNELINAGKLSVRVEDVIQIDPKPVLLGNTDVPGLSIFGGRRFWEAISKIAINYFLCSGGNVDEIEGFINVFKDKEYTLRLLVHPYQSKMYWGREIVSFKKKTNTVFHLLYLIGYKTTGILYCYIELFSFFRYYVILSHSYSGNPISYVYCYDLIEEQNISEDAEIIMPTSFKNKHFFEHSHYLHTLNRGSTALLVESYNQVIRLIDERQIEIRQKRLDE